MAVVTIESYLRGKVGFEIPDSALSTIFVDRYVQAGTDVEDLDRRTRDLCTADLYMWCATASPGTRNSVSDSDGGWTHTDGGWSNTREDRRRLRAMAMDIYNKYGESLNQKSRIVIINL